MKRRKTNSASKNAPQRPRQAVPVNVAAVNDIDWWHYIKTGVVTALITAAFGAVGYALTSYVGMRERCIAEYNAIAPQRRTLATEVHLRAKQNIELLLASKDANDLNARTLTKKAYFNRFFKEYTDDDLVNEFNAVSRRFREVSYVHALDDYINAARQVVARQFSETFVHSHHGGALSMPMAPTIDSALFAGAIQLHAIQNTLLSFEANLSAMVDTTFNCGFIDVYRNVIGGRPYIHNETFIGSAVVAMPPPVNLTLDDVKRFSIITIDIKIEE